MLPAPRTTEARDALSSLSLLIGGGGGADGASSEALPAVTGGGIGPLRDRAVAFAMRSAWLPLLHRMRPNSPAGRRTLQAALVASLCGLMFGLTVGLSATMLLRQSDMEDCGLMSAAPLLCMRWPHCHLSLVRHGNVGAAVAEGREESGVAYLCEQRAQCHALTRAACAKEEHCVYEQRTASCQPSFGFTPGLSGLLAAAPTVGGMLGCGLATIFAAMTSRRRGSVVQSPSSEGASSSSGRRSRSNDGAGNGDGPSVMQLGHPHVSHAPAVGSMPHDNRGDAITTPVVATPTAASNNAPPFAPANTTTPSPSSVAAAGAAFITSSGQSRPPSDDTIDLVHGLDAAAIVTAVCAALICLLLAATYRPAVWLLATFGCGLGVGTGAFTALSPVFVAATAMPSRRTTVGSLFQVVNTFGIATPPMLAWMWGTNAGAMCGCVLLVAAALALREVCESEMRQHADEILTQSKQAISLESDGQVAAPLTPSQLLGPSSVADGPSHSWRESESTATADQPRDDPPRPSLLVGIDRSRNAEARNVGVATTTHLRSSRHPTAARSPPPTPSVVGSFSSDATHNALRLVSSSHPYVASVHAFVCTHRRALVAATVLAAAQQLTGINAVLVFAPQLGHDLGIARLTGSVLITSWNFASCALGLPLVQRVRPIPLYITACLLQSVASAAIATAIGWGFPHWVTAASVTAYIGCFELGMGPLFYVIAAELFPVAARVEGCAIANMLRFVFNIAVNLGFPTLISVLYARLGSVEAAERAAYFGFSAVGVVTGLLLASMMTATGGWCWSRLCAAMRLASKEEDDDDGAPNMAPPISV